MNKTYYVSRLQYFNENNECVKQDCDVYHGEDKNDAIEQFNNLNSWKSWKLGKNEHAMRILYEVTENSLDPKIKYDVVKIYRTH